MTYPVYNGLRTAGPVWVQWLGFAVAALAFPVFLLTGLDLAGWAYGALLFAANRGVAYATDRLARGKMEVTAVGITGVGFISRAWITVAMLFAIAELVSKDVGIAAALSFLVYFTVDMLTRSVAHMIARSSAGTTPGEVA